MFAGNGKRPGKRNPKKENLAKGESAKALYTAWKEDEEMPLAPNSPEEIAHVDCQRCKQAARVLGNTLQSQDNPSHEQARTMAEQQQARTRGDN